MSGWGKNDFVTGTYQTIQKQVDVPILQPAQCQASLSATRLGTQFQYDTTSFICAGGEIGRDACTVCVVTIDHNHNYDQLYMNIKKQKEKKKLEKKKQNRTNFFR